MDKMSATLRPVLSINRKYGTFVSSCEVKIALPSLPLPPPPPSPPSPKQ